jgi:hypothetical protein
MKAVQSFWINDTNIDQLHNIKGGWIDARYHLMSWCLSCLLLKKHFNHVELVTDNYGKTILIDLLKLPYDTVRNDLEEQKEDINNMWVMGKLFTYSIQDEPFIHVDGDAFIFKKPSHDFLKSPLFSQNLEIDFPLYKDCLDACLKSGIELPSFLKGDLEKPVAANAGLIGGQNFEFFKENYKVVKSFLSVNRNKIKDAKGIQDLPIIIEQLFYPFHANAKSIKINQLLKPSFAGKCAHLGGFIDLNNDTNPCTFVHLLGFYKQHLFYCKQMEAQLKMLFPEYHQRVVDLLNNGEWKFEDIKLGHLHDDSIPEIRVLDHSLLKAVQLPYKKSNTIVELLKIDFPEITQNNFVEALKSAKDLIESSNHNKSYVMLADCMVFENSKYNLLRKALYEVSERQEDEWRRQQAFPNLFKKPFLDRLDDEIVMSNEGLLIESSWNWRYLSNLDSNVNGFFITEILVNYDTLYVQEFIHDDFYNFLAKNCQTKITLKGLLKKFLALFESPLSQESKNNLIAKLEQRLKESYLNGTICYIQNREIMEKLSLETALAS